MGSAFSVLGMLNMHGGNVGIRAQSGLLGLSNHGFGIVALALLGTWDMIYPVR